MSNHPNRGRPRNSPVHPTTEMIKAERAAAGLTQTEAAARIYCTLRAWQDWEGGQRRMHPQFWESWLQKTKHLRAASAAPLEAAGKPAAGE